MSRAPAWCPTCNQRLPANRDIFTNPCFECDRKRRMAALAEEHLRNQPWAKAQIEEAFEWATAFMKDVMETVEKKKKSEASPDPKDTVWTITLIENEDTNAVIDTAAVTGIDRPPNAIKRNGLSYRLMRFDGHGDKGTASYLICPILPTDEWSDWSELKGEPEKDRDWIVALFESDAPGVPPLAACIIRGCPWPPGCVEKDGKRYRIARSETMMSGPGHARYVYTGIQDKSAEDWGFLVAENTEEADSDEVSFYTCVIGGRHLSSGLINELRGAWMVGLVYGRPKRTTKSIQENLKEMIAGAKLLCAQTAMNKDRDIRDRIQDRLEEQVLYEGGLKRKEPCKHPSLSGRLRQDRDTQIIACSDCGKNLKYTRAVIE